MNSKSRERFKFLKTMYRAAPLPAAELDELKSLAKLYDRKLYNYLENGEAAK